MDTRSKTLMKSKRNSTVTNLEFILSRMSCRSFRRVDWLLREGKKTRLEWVK